jgi:hypothetical protein
MTARDEAVPCPAREGTATSEGRARPPELGAGRRSARPHREVGDPEGGKARARAAAHAFGMGPRTGPSAWRSAVVAHAMTHGEETHADREGSSSFQPWATKGSTKGVLPWFHFGSTNERALPMYWSRNGSTETATRFPPRAAVMPPNSAITSSLEQTCARPPRPPHLARCPPRAPFRASARPGARVSRGAGSHAARFGSLARPPARTRTTRRAAHARSFVRSTFGTQAISQRPSSPAYGFGSSTRAVHAKTFQLGRAPSSSSSPGPARYSLHSSSAVGSQAVSRTRGARGVARASSVSRSLCAVL